MGLLTLNELSGLGSAWLATAGGRTPIPGIWTRRGIRNQSLWRGAGPGRASGIWSRRGIERAAAEAEAPGFQRQLDFMEAFRAALRHGRGSESWHFLIRMYDTPADRAEIRRLLRLHELTERRRRERMLEAQRRGVTASLAADRRRAAQERRREEAEFWAARRHAAALENAATRAALARARAATTPIYGPPAPAGWAQPVPPPTMQATQATSGTLVSSLPAAPPMTYGAF